MRTDIAAALLPVIRALEALGIGYFIGGSVASSARGLPRTTIDADLVADLTAHHVLPLVDHLQVGYYIDAEMIYEALRDLGSFNIIHYETMLKIDIFMLKPDPYDQRAFERASPGLLPGSATPKLRLASPEDIVLHKLYWYRLGGEVSERQWTDVLGVLKVQRDALDFAYMHRWAEDLGVPDLLEQALAEAGLASGV